VIAWCKALAKLSQYSSEVPTEYLQHKVKNQETADQIEYEHSLLPAMLKEYAAKEKTIYYKVHVGAGNNSVLIRALFKQRVWWLLHDKEELDRVNLMWTQNPK
jgi:hypothetical protein